MPRTKPVSRGTDAAAPTTGTAFAIPWTAGRITTVKVYVNGLAYVGLGTAASPPPATASNTVYQEANTEVAYDLEGAQQADGAYVYVYAAASTIIARVSFFS